MAFPKLTVLGIESSCDESAASVVVRHRNGTGDILSNVVRTQVEDHARFGGIVPELAARAHVSVLDRVIAAAMDSANLSFKDLSAMAVTAGPGLMGGLLVGTVTASAIATAQSLPLYGINHLEGHALSAVLTDRVAFPYLLLLVSGGHTQILLVSQVGQYRRLGSTLDDALGEAFDKTAKLLGLGFPGGPEVEKLARQGNSERFNFPRPLMGTPGCDFSFSGLKTAVRRQAQGLAPLSDVDRADLCACFQAAIGDVIEDRLARGLAQLRQEGSPAGAVVAAGGVAANAALRAKLKALCDAEALPFVVPPPALCTDNGAMIAWAAACRMAQGLKPDAAPVARSRWPLDGSAEPIIGSGRKGAKA